MKTSYALTAEQEQEAARIEDIVIAAARAEARQIARLLASKSQKRGYLGSSVTCRECRQRRKFVQHRPRRLTTLLGSVHYERADYSGCRCGGGWTPLDDSLRLVDQLTWGAAELVTLHGNLGSFDEAATKALPRTSGLHISPATVRRVTEGIGGDMGCRQQAGVVFGDPQPWEWETDHHGRRCCYLSLDATM